MIFCNSASSIRDIRPFCRPLFRHSCAVKNWVSGSRKKSSNSGIWFGKTRIGNTNYNCVILIEWFFVTSCVLHFEQDIFPEQGNLNLLVYKTCYNAVGKNTEYKLFDSNVQDSSEFRVCTRVVEVVICNYWLINSRNVRFNVGDLSKEAIV